jgi:hypothetical protein
MQGAETASGNRPVKTKRGARRRGKVFCSVSGSLQTDSPSLAQGDAILARDDERKVEANFTKNIGPPCSKTEHESQRSFKDSSIDESHQRLTWIELKLNII